MKKKLNRVLFSGLSLSLLFLLSGCVSQDSHGNPTGTIWHVLGEPMAKLIQHFANNMDLGFGLAIIVSFFRLDFTNHGKQVTNQKRWLT